MVHVGVSALVALTVATADVAHANGPRSDPGPPTKTDLIAEIEAVTDGTAQIAYHAETGQVRFIGMTTNQPIERSSGLARSAPADTVARGFLDQYGSLFGLSDEATELRTTDEVADEGGRAVRFQQVYRGVPVLSGELVVNVDGAGNVVAAGGEVLPGPKPNVVPSIDSETARQQAVELVAKQYGVDATALSTSTPELWIHNPALIGGPGIRMTSLVWRVEVSSTGEPPVRELVLVHAQLGRIVLHYSELEEALFRRVCDRNGRADPYECTPAKTVRREGQRPTGKTDVDDAYDLSGLTYNFYRNRYGRDSVDGKGKALLSTVRYCPMGCPFQNAFWDGNQMVYGPNYASADDVVGHELTHGVTDFTSHLNYYYQSGAINESLSDVFGELIDQSSTLSGRDAAAARWRMGEDLPIGAIRNMKNPGQFGDPDRVGSANYWSSPDDNGGVHSNSGVNNKAAVLMVDGGAFRGRTVTKLGRTVADSIAKVGRLYYEVENNLLTSGSDYQDLFSYLPQACRQLIGVRPPAASTAFTTANCANVVDAVTATQMNLVPADAPNTKAAVCPTGRVPAELFWDDLETPNSGNWVKSSSVVSTGWFYPQNTHPFAGFDATYAESGRFNFWGDDHNNVMDASIARTGNVTVPTGRTTYLYFDHAYQFESGFFGVAFDGGVVEYSTDDGATWQPTDGLPTLNGYDATIQAGGGNPIEGRRAFGGGSNGYQATRIDISSLAGNAVRFRFRIGTDFSNGEMGWFVDDISVYNCVPKPADPVAPNKLRNQSFEFDWERNTFVDSWSANDRFLRSAVAHRTGQFSARLQDPANSGSFTVSQKVTVRPRSRNRFVGYIRIPATPDAFTFRAELVWRARGGAAIGNPVVLHSRHGATGGAWVKMARARLVAPAGTVQAEIRLVAGSLGAPAFVDDFYFGR
jgi:Zn-dependent metalloprotease